MEHDITDSWNHDLQPTSRLQRWAPTTTSEVYLFLKILIYMSIQIEVAIKDYWKDLKPGEQLPLHPFIKFMPYDRFQLLYRHIRLIRHTDLQQQDLFPLVFQHVAEWSDHIQKTSIELFSPGSHLAVDECMTCISRALALRVVGLFLKHSLLSSPVKTVDKNSTKALSFYAIWLT